MKHIFILFITVFFTQISFGQQTIIRGKVTDENGIPIPLARIYVSGTTIGTSGDELGNYILKIPTGKNQVFVEMIGFQADSFSVEITSDESREYNIQLPQLTRDLQGITISAKKTGSATGTRTLTDIQDIPQAIVVIGQRTIEQQAVFDLTSITRNITGINFTGSYSGGGSYQLFNARGFDMVNSQNYRWNGQMIWNLGNQYGDNIEQVEFLKGPTSILFGDVSPGGILNFVTKKPLSSFYTAINFKTGQWGLIRPSVDLSGPLTKNKLLRYRINTTYEQSNSFRENVEYSRFMIAPSLVWNIGEKWQWNLDGVVRTSRSTDDAGLVSPDGTISGLSQFDPDTYLGEPDREYLFNDQNVLSTLNYQLGDNWRIRNVTYYGNTKNRPWGIWPDAPDENRSLYRNEYGYNQWLRNFSTSFEFLGSIYTGGVKHNLLFGGEYQRTNFRYTNEGYLAYLDSINLDSFQPGLFPGTEPIKEPYLPFVSIIERGGAYIQDQMMFFEEKLHVLAGARFGFTTQGNDYNEIEAIGTDYEGYTDDLVTVRVFTPRVGLVFKPKKNLSIYASYSSGYEVNSPDVFALNYLDFSTPPATRSNQWETGIKSSLSENKLATSLTFFHIQKKDPYGYIYVPDSSGNINYDEYNVYYEGLHQSLGVEFDFDGKIADVLTLTGGLAFTKTEIIEDPGYESGNQLPNAPKYTANFWINYDPQGKLQGLSIGGGYFFKSSFYSFFDNSENLKVPSSFTVDIAVGYTYHSFGAQLNITNITNEVNYLNPWAFNLFDIQPLRRAVITLSWTFSKKPKE